MALLFKHLYIRNLTTKLKNVQASTLSTYMLKKDNTYYNQTLRTKRQMLMNESCSVCHRGNTTRLIYQNSVHYQSGVEKNVEDPDNSKKEEENPGKLKRTGQLAKVFAEYGTTAIVFHTTISLTSLGICYTAVSSGIDVVSLLQSLNLISEATTEGKIAGGAGTFVIAYACHKVFMPLRIFITVTCTPIIVKKLRSIGLLKNVKKAN